MGSASHPSARAAVVRTAACGTVRAPGPTGRNLHDAMGEVLRAAYDSLKREPLPAHLVALAERLDRTRP